MCVYTTYIAQEENREKEYFFKNYKVTGVCKKGEKVLKKLVWEVMSPPRQDHYCGKDKSVGAGQHIPPQFSE